MKNTDYAAFAAMHGLSTSRAVRPIVCVQGLGFVGLAMSLAVALARDAAGEPCFNVIGVELPTPHGRATAAAINAAQLPIVSEDPSMPQALEACRNEGNLIAVTGEAAYALASVVVVDINLDLQADADGVHVPMEGFLRAVGAIGRQAQPGTLVVVESTAPPGTCEKLIGPELDRCCQARGLAPGSILLAHAYERVMPGRNYLDSVRNFWRVYAGRTPEAARACGDFLSQVVNTKEYPLRQLHSTTASETAKVLENSYRAVNIAFIEEWSRFAEMAGVDLFEVIDAIRVRPTHNNIRQPGLGVGGYCLTKDPLFAKWAAAELFGRQEMRFPFSEQAIAVNDAMPLSAVRILEEALDGLEGRRILLMGVSYRQDVGDTRCSPSERFARAVMDRGGEMAFHDPLVRQWREMELSLPEALPSPEGVDAVLFAVAHTVYRELEMERWLGQAQPLVMDANNVLQPGQRRAASRAGCRVISLGRGADG